MSKIEIKNDILDLNLFSRISTSADSICFFRSEISGDCLKIVRGVDLTNDEFNTLRAWLLNETNNPHTMVIA